MPRLTVEELQKRAASIQEECCTGPCNKVLPLSEAYFHRDETSATGFMDICKVCRAEQRAVEEGRNVVAVIEQIEQRGLDLLAENFETGKAAGCPHSATTFEDILTYFGGSQGFAKQVYGQYLMCKPGSAGRTKIITMMIGMQLKLTEQGLAEKPTDKMTDEELRSKLESALKIHQPPAIRDVG